MVIAGLVFEYVDVAAALNNKCRSMVSGAILLAVLQLPSPGSAPVTARPYRRLERLAPIMNLVPPSMFARLCRSIGLRQAKTDTVPLKKRKAFFRIDQPVHVFTQVSRDLQAFAILGDFSFMHAESYIPVAGADDDHFGNGKIGVDRMGGGNGAHTSDGHNGESDTSLEHIAVCNGHHAASVHEILQCAYAAGLPTVDGRKKRVELALQPISSFKISTFLT